MLFPYTSTSRLKNDNLLPLLNKIVCHTQASNASSHNHHISAHVLLQFWVLYPLVILVPNIVPQARDSLIFLFRYTLLGKSCHGALHTIKYFLVKCQTQISLNANLCDLICWGQERVSKAQCACSALKIGNSWP